MQTSQWGPSAWKLLHLITFAAPPGIMSKDQRRIYQRFFALLGDILPCKYCRISYRQFIKEDPIDVTSGRRLSHWLYRIHNKVNKKLDVTHIPPYWQVKQTYQPVSKWPLNDQTCWIFLYCVAYNARPEDRSQRDVYYQWFDLLAQVIPWPAFRQVYSGKCLGQTWFDYVYGLEQRTRPAYNQRYQQIASMKATNCSVQARGCTK